MARVPAAVADALPLLGRTDPVLAGLIARHGPPPLGRRTPPSKRFESLAASIVYQQLAGKAAATIHGRLVAALGGVVSPKALLAAPAEVLAGSGLSRAKAAAIVDLAEKVLTGEVALDRIGRLPDRDVVDHLVQVRGIGPWTADMFLLFDLGRLDVWPTGDLGVRAGYGAAWGLPATPSPADLEERGERFRPYRSIVAWYCWRAVEDRKPEGRA